MGIPALVLGRQSCWDQDSIPFSSTQLQPLHPAAQRMETVMIFGASKGRRLNSTMGPGLVSQY